MKRTSNYSLPQWENNDTLMMSDFNTAMSTIDSSMRTNKTTAEAAFSPTKMPFAIGSYTGTGGNLQIAVGFKPSAVVIFGVRQTSSEEDYKKELNYFAIANGTLANSSRIKILDSGFVMYPDEYNGYSYPKLNSQGRYYIYMAFR